MPICLRFYAELNDFLPRQRRDGPFLHDVPNGTAVKDVIEGLGVPHTEVDLVLVNGVSVPFSHRVAGGDRVSVYPVFEALEIATVTRVRPRPLRDPRFVLDVHLGRLARHLRLAGFDAEYRNDFADAELVERAVADRRILLTRDRGVLKHTAVTHGYAVRSTVPADQFREVLRRFDLFGRVAPFTRCLQCNFLLVETDATEVSSRIPPRVRARHTTFRMCQGCGRVYWAGTHHDRLSTFLRTALTEGPCDPAQISGSG